MSEIRFDGKVVAITGAGGGLGAAYARLLAERGASVVVNDLGTAMEGEGRSSEAADRMVAEIRQAGGTAVADYGDITDPAAAAALVDGALSRYGRLDGVINNAGIIIRGRFLETTPELLNRHLAVHLMGSLNVTQAAWPALVDAKGAVLFTVSAGMLGSPHAVAYNTAKAAVLGLMRSVACEGALSGVRVNAVMPGAETRMQGDAGSAASAARALVQVNSPANAAVAACYLLHDSCTANGDVFAIGRGLTARIVLASTAGVAEREPTLESMAAGFDDVVAFTGLREERDLPGFRDRLIAVWNGESSGENQT
ncbi:SDR family NAD(P)-dependent oxidoreductase [Jatrophihabitans sp.]|uniref:SDR family NAD(P)-dependent oxidoreductase n=1 Tax=Jatrophihabitans sp. TaxID=1932789 RepID=UPI0030C70563|nr:putative short-chain type dehydrogenase/reductase [Jatrophihabitans sp.]